MITAAAGMRGHERERAGVPGDQVVVERHYRRQYHRWFTTGSFAYTPEQMRDLVNEWTDLAIDYQNSFGNAYEMTRVEGPGTEFVSRSYAGDVNWMGQAYLDVLPNRIDYCYAQAQKFQDCLDEYLGVEHRSVREITKAGPQEGI